MMSDQDYIREGVEIAYGWDWNTYSHVLTISKNCARDALAGQLIRQVEDEYEFLSLDDFVCIRGRGRGNTDIITHARGMDRTMNAIKAIVDLKLKLAA